MSEPHLEIRKTYKLYLGGAFPRSESGRSYEVLDHTGKFLANVAQASRKDVRDAVLAARAGQAAWWRQSAANRGLVLYRAAEMLEGRRSQMAELVAASEGVDRALADDQVSQSIDRLVWYAGWTDKLAQVRGGANPVAGPYFNQSVPEPTGVIGIVAPAESSLLGFVSVLAPVLASGNAAVIVASERRPLPAMEFAEVLATSDLPAGVANILAGRTDELARPLATHHDLDGLDLAGVDLAVAGTLAAEAAATITRVLLPITDEDFTADPGLKRLTRFTEIKTVWHTAGR